MLSRRDHITFRKEHRLSHHIWREHIFFWKNLNFYLTNFIFQNKLNPKAVTFENFVRHTAALQRNPSKTIRI